MKGILVAIVSVAVLAVVGFLALPSLIDKEIGSLKSDIQDLKVRVQKMEELVKSEDEAKKSLQLQPDAELQKVIKAVNSLSLKVNAFEDSYKKGITTTNEAVEKQRALMDETLKKQTEAVQKANKEIQSGMQKIMFNSSMASIRGHILKARTDLFYKNIGTAKNELDLLSNALENSKTLASDDNKRSIEALQVQIKKVRADVDTDLSAAITGIDLLWHEMGKLLGKG